MKKTALIPIDNRPVCYTLPQMTAAINSDFKLILPNRRLLGDLSKEADTNALFEWLEDLKDVDYIVISADTLLYGGLIPSRRSLETKEDLDKKILRLRNILLNKPNCKTYVFSSIMRISNNNVNEEEKEYWSDWGKKIYEYSYNLHKFEVEGNNSSKEKAKELSAEIPKEILIDWLSTRSRNFDVNKSLLKLYDDGVINTLVYSKDDCGQYGLNIKEAKYFEYETAERPRAAVKTGADEIPLALIARCMSDGHEVKFAPFFTNPESTDKISNYEDISVKKSVESQIYTAGGDICDKKEADIILYVNNFKDKQGELVMGERAEEFSGFLASFDRPSAIVDIVNANGSDNGFVRELFKTKLNGLIGYAGWNTTGNSLGSAISAAIFNYFAQKTKSLNSDAFKKLLAVRFLDDWAYQANLREKLIAENINDLFVIKELFKPYEDVISKVLNYDCSSAKYSFPWNRFFEIEIEI
ncbi:MAG: DUF4127 family protein [Candidatus Gastranaerophilaceae bacterium]